MNKKSLLLLLLIGGPLGVLLSLGGEVSMTVLDNSSVLGASGSFVFGAIYGWLNPKPRRFAALGGAICGAGAAFPGITMGLILGHNDATVLLFGTIGGFVLGTIGALLATLISRRSTKIVLALLLFAIPACRRVPKAVPATPQALEGCTTSSTPSGAHFDCETVVATIDESKVLTPTTAVEVGVAGFRAIVGDTAKVEKTILIVRGKDFPAVSITGTGANANPLVAQILAFATSGGTRLVSCTGSGDDQYRMRCAALVAELVENGIPKIERPLTETPTFASRKVNVPDGCTLVQWTASGWRIKCGRETTLGWLQVEDIEQAARMADEMSKQMFNLFPRAKSNQVECKVANTPTTCTQVDSGADPHEARAVLAAVRVGDSPLFVHCTHPTREPLPPLCAGLFSF